MKEQGDSIETSVDFWIRQAQSLNIVGVSLATLKVLRSKIGLWPITWWYKIYQLGYLGHISWNQRRRRCLAF